MGLAAAQAAPPREVRYLSGRDNVHTATWDFYCTGGRQSGYWTTIQVPSCWEQQGFGSYNYGRDYKTYGKNFRFAAFLWLTFLAIASGSQGPRKMAPFCRSNAAFLTAYFDLRHGLPSQGAFRDLLQALDKEALAQAFGRWFTPHVQAGNWVAGDGQSLRSTVRDAHGASQSLASAGPPFTVT